MMIRYMAFFLIAFAVSGCGKDTLLPKQYAGWVQSENNGLKRIKTIGSYKLSFQYRPLEYVIVMEEQTEQLKRTRLSERMNELKDLQYFSLRLESTDPRQQVMDIGNESEQDYFEKVNYFSFAMQNDISLVQGSDTLKCRLLQADRTYDMTPYIDLTMAFDRGKEEECDKEFIFDGSRLGIGTVKIRIDKESLMNIPTLTTY